MTRSKRADPDARMSVGEHLRELRRRVAVCLAALLAGFLICLGCAPALVRGLTALGEECGYSFVYLAPQELLMVYLSLALTGAVVAAFPFIGYHAYAFCGPGLKPGERGFLLGALLFGSLCFVAGVLFAYFLSVPFMLRFLIGLRSEVSVRAAISIREYVNFLLTVFVVFGAVFELPVVSVLLAALGVLRADWMVRARRYVIVLIFLLAAVITPPDVLSQVMVALPMIALYELSILLCRIFGRREREAKPES